MTNTNKKWRYVPVDDPSQQYLTSDIGVATALLCLGYKLLNVDKENPQKALFVFRLEDDIEQTANQYFSDTLEVRARSFMDHLKALKNLLYN